MKHGLDNVKEEQKNHKNHIASFFERLIQYNGNGQDAE